MLLRDYTKLHFKSVEGQLLYYPRGFLGVSYVVDRPTQARILSFLKAYMLALVAALIAFVALWLLFLLDEHRHLVAVLGLAVVDQRFPAWMPDASRALLILSPVLAVLIAVFELWLRRVTSRLKPAAIRISREQVIAERAVMIPRQSIEAIFWVLAVLLVMKGLSILDGFTNHGLNGLLNILGFFVLLWCFACFHRLRQIRQAADASATPTSPSASQPGR
jgi:hypothetical protein